MSRTLLLSGSMVVALSASAASAQAEDKVREGTKIMTAADNRDDGKDQVATVTLEVQPKGQTKRLRRFVSLRKEGQNVTKLVTYFVAPADVRDAAFLVWDKRGATDDRWLYLPAVGKVRRVAASGSRQSFFGSDFVYEDLTVRDVELDGHTLFGSQKVDGWDCWVVDSKPKDAKSVDFVRFRTWVTKDGSVILRQEYFDASNAVVRRYQAKSLKKIQNILTVQQATMWNLKSGSQSRFEISGVKYNTGVADERLTEAQLNRGAPTP